MLAGLSGAQVGWIHGEKNSQKSRDTVPLCFDSALTADSAWSRKNCLVDGTENLVVTLIRYILQCTLYREKVLHLFSGCVLKHVHHRNDALLAIFIEVA